MPKNSKERLISVLKEQAELFLLDASEFFPFATYIDKNDRIVPTGAYVEDLNDRPASVTLIELLDKGLRQRISDDDCIIGAIAVDIVIKEGDVRRDAIQFRFYEKDLVYFEHLKYDIQNHKIHFY